MTFDEWWKTNQLTPEMMGSLEKWARLVWETAHANGVTEGFNEGSAEGFESGYESACDR